MNSDDVRSQDLRQVPYLPFRKAGEIQTIYVATE